MLSHPFRGEHVLLLFWALCLLQLVTVTPSTQFLFLEPLSPEFYGLLGLYLLTSIFVLKGQPKRIVVLLHLLSVLIFIISHPLTSYFGRDGSWVVCAIYALLVLHFRTPFPAQWKLLLGSSFLGLILLETGLSALDDFGNRWREDLKDYGDVMGDYHEGGFLIPNLDLRVVGENGPARFVTNDLGFRTRRSVTYEKPEGTYRILFIGDSFVAGYRTDQEETVGQVLEYELQKEAGSIRLEVLIAGAGHPGAYFSYLEHHAFKFEPDLILVGITLGNDISQSYAARSGNGQVIANAYLPDDAFLQSYWERLPIRLDRSLRYWRTYERLSGLTRPDPIGSWYPDVPTRVHLFDAAHSLGHFYVRRPVGLVERSYQDLRFYLRGMNALCQVKGSEFVATLIPQHFQIRPQQWQALAIQYGLDLSGFDFEAPNRRILEDCRSGGIECVDLLPAFKNGGGSSYYLPRGDMHWNSRGHSLAASVLKEYLLPKLQRE